VVSQTNATSKQATHLSTLTPSITSISVTSIITSTPALTSKIATSTATSLLSTLPTSTLEFPTSTAETRNFSKYISITPSTMVKNINVKSTGISSLQKSSSTSLTFTQSKSFTPITRWSTSTIISPAATSGNETSMTISASATKNRTVRPSV